MKLEEILYKLLVKYTSKTIKHIDDIGFYIKGCKHPFVIIPSIQALAGYESYKEVENILSRSQVLLPTDYTRTKQNWFKSDKNILEENLANITKIRVCSEDLDEILTLEEVMGDG